MMKADVQLDLESETRSQKEEALEVQRMIDMHDHQAKTLDSMQTPDEVTQITETDASINDGELAFTMQMIK